jgi:hypothetical protein
LKPLAPRFSFDIGQSHGIPVGKACELLNMFILRLALFLVYQDAKCSIVVVAVAIAVAVAVACT